MSRNESGADYDGPTERSTASDYQYCSHSKGRGPGIDDATVNDVFAAVREAHTGERSYLSATDLDVEGCTRLAIGKSLSALADDAGCPLDLERWSGKGTTPATYRVEARGQSLVTDGGETAGTAPAIPNVTGELVDGEGQVIGELETDVVLPAHPTFDVVTVMRALAKFEERVGGERVNIGLVENQQDHEIPVLALWSAEEPERALLVAPRVDRRHVTDGDALTVHNATDGDEV